MAIQADDQIQEKKKSLRALYLRKLKEIPSALKLQTATELPGYIMPKLPNKGLILSFHSLPTEIDTQLLNQILAYQGRLVLPVIEKNELQLFQVENTNTDLILSSFGIWQPKVEKCRFRTLSEIKGILVPALAFDAKGFRLGRGLGHYDRLLAGKTIPCWGLGFAAQLHPCALPIEEHDVPVDTLQLI